MYKETLPRSEEAMTVSRNNTPVGTERFTISGKVNRICQRFLDALQDKYSTNLRNVITAQVCQTPPNLEAALEVVNDLRNKQSDMAETAVEHICFLADVNHVYDTALGMYDIDLTLLVAQQSQKVCS